MSAHVLGWSDRHPLPICVHAFGQWYYFCLGIQLIFIICDLYAANGCICVFGRCAREDKDWEQQRKRECVCACEQQVNTLTAAHETETEGDALMVVVHCECMTFGSEHGNIIENIDIARSSVIEAIACCLRCVIRGDFTMKVACFHIRNLLSCIRKYVYMIGWTP